MDQSQEHPVPRQITTFEFKLIGFMTLKQFIYLLIFFPSGFIVYSLFPVPVLNIMLGVFVAAVGLALGFVPVYDRPLDVWLKNLFKRLTTPTQYLYQKQNSPPTIFKNMATDDAHRINTHLDSQQKLNQYLGKKNPPDALQRQQTEGRQRVSEALQEPVVWSTPQDVSPTTHSAVPDPLQDGIAIDTQEPTLMGVVKNNKEIPLPGVLIYIKDKTNKPIRLLKTNPHGVFATYSNLNPGEYTFEIKDPKGTFFFDTMKISLESKNKPLEFHSKELI